MANKRIDELIGAVTYDGLIVDTDPVAHVTHIKVAASLGVLARGTVVTGTAGAAMGKVTKALVATNATYILAEDVDTGTGDAVVALAYRTGHFAANKLITDGTYALAAADKEILRNCGILLSDALDY